MSLRQAQREIDSQEFAEWAAYSELDPFGEDRADLRNAIVATQISNAFRGRGQTPFKPKDFMPDFADNPHVHQRTAEELKERFRALMGNQNG